MWFEVAERSFFYAKSLRCIINLLVTFVREIECNRDLGIFQEEQKHDRLKMNVEGVI